MQSTSDITPSCDFVTGGPQPTTACAIPNTAGSGGQGSTERMIYRTAPMDFAGVPAPPAGGYTFHTTPPPARNTPTNISCSGITIRAKMFPFKKPGKPLATTLSKCFDSAPTFAESPVPLVITSSDKYIYNNNAKDIDGDSITFAFDQPWQANNSRCNFTPPYNVNKPIPGDPTLDIESGELIYRPLNVGKFVTCIKVTSYRCGQKIAEIYRDFQTEIIAKPINYEDNSPPDISAPFDNNSIFDTTVVAGSVIKFKIEVEDLDLPSFSTGYQNIQLMFNSEHFGTNYIDTVAGCLSPPCAMINLSEDLKGPAPKQYFNNQDELGYGYDFPGGTAEGKGSLWFYWPTACENLQANECGPAQARNFRFVIRGRDGACPAPGQTSKTITIRVLPSTEIKSPEVKTAEVLANGDVKLSWEKPEGDPLSFVSYNIYSSPNKFASTFKLAGTVTNFLTTSFTDAGADAYGNSKLFYFVETISTCLNTVSEAIDTIQVIKAIPSYNIFGGNIKVAWNPLRTPLLSSSATEYKVWREYPVGSGFTEVGSTAATEFFDDLGGSVCQDSVNYKVTIADNAISENSVSTIGKTYISSMQPELTATIPDQCKTTVNFNANVSSGGAPPFTYEWSGDDGFQGFGNQISYNYSGPGKFGFKLKVTDNADCVVEIIDTVNFESAMGVSFTNDEVCFGDLTNLSGTVQGGKAPYTYEWRTPAGVFAGNSLDVENIFSQSGDLSVTLKVTDSDNCSNESTQTVFVDPCVPSSESRLYLPDAFSPNGDGNNDVFNIQAFNLTEYSFSVFNRWGERVYQTTNFEEDWDGKVKGEVVKAGVYVYVLNAEGADGQVYKKKGTITITP